MYALGRAGAQRSPALFCAYLGAVKRRNTRLIARLAACTLAGAVITVAVAWGCAIWGREKRNGPELSDVAWSMRLPDWPELATHSYWSSTPGLVLGFEIGGFRHGGPQDRIYRIATTEAGLPLLSMRGYSANWISTKTRPFGPVLRRGWHLETEGFYGRDLPVVPVWPGFALDTAFYGAIVLALWSAPGVIRRRTRKRRGRCPACGYDLRGSAGGPCPECGA
jgi:hypothetical protein